MKNLNLIDSFFNDPNDYISFLTSKKQITIANNNGTCFAELKKEDGKYLYTLTWLEDGKMIGDYISPFRATKENIDKFNNGCKILAERLAIYIVANEPNAVPSSPPAFGELTKTHSKFS